MSARQREMVLAVARVAAVFPVGTALPDAVRGMLLLARQEAA